jgi:hypothetical protein
VLWAIEVVPVNLAGAFTGEQLRALGFIGLALIRPSASIGGGLDFARPPMQQP